MFVAPLPLFLLLASAETHSLRAGAAQVDINPRTLPAIINCGFLERSGAEIRGNLFARSLVLDDAQMRISITVVDSCMMPRELIDEAKRIASAKTGIPADRMLVSATHTHSAPAAMACLGSRQQQDYAKWLPGQIAESIGQAAAKLEPARAGAASIDAPEHTFCRRWIYKPEKMLQDPFGEVSVRANMIPGFENPDVISPAGPVDSELSIVSVVSKAGGKPIAVLANYANHYFGATPVSPDYFGLFDQRLAEKIGGGIVMMSQGTSGDSNTSNYSKPRATWTIDEYANGLVDLAHRAYQQIRYTAGVPVRMAEAKLELGRRLANRARLDWAESMVKVQKGEKPANQPEVYAHEQLFLRDTPRRELKLQAVRIGDIALTGIPNEVYALTGLKLKARSPLARTINLELANGAEGYIPPPEQHAFGGYTTWAARSAGLEVTAEPKIVATLLGLLENVTGLKRRDPEAAHRKSKAAAYWPLDDLEYGVAKDAAGKRDARHEGRLAVYLSGDPAAAGANRAVYFAGGSVSADLTGLGSRAYSVEFRFWPGTGDASKDLLTLNDGQFRTGEVAAAPRQWHQALLIRTAAGKTQFFVDGRLQTTTGDVAELKSLRLGGSGFEGKIDEAAVYGRALPIPHLPNRASR